MFTTELSSYKSKSKRQDWPSGHVVHQYAWCDHTSKALDIYHASSSFNLTMPLFSVLSTKKKASWKKSKPKFTIHMAGPMHNATWFSKNIVHMLLHKNKHWKLLPEDRGKPNEQASCWNEWKTNLTCSCCSRPITAGQDAADQLPICQTSVWWKHKRV